MFRSFVFCILLVAGSFSFAQINPATVRIRLFKDLAEFPQIREAKIKKVSESMWRLQGRNLSFQNKKLPSENLVVLKPNEKFDVISVLDFNSYLAGVLAGEMPLKWPLEALKTQAVVARSFALARMKERKNKVFHLDSNQMDQVFSMTNSEKAFRAVIETENTVLKDVQGNILKAFYHADCGGQTVPASEVWDRAIDSGVASDPWCANRKLNEWNFEISKEDFFEKIGQSSEASRLITFFKSRVQTLQLGTEIFSVQKIREVFGFMTVKNSPQEIVFNENAVKMSGRGFGHGAGLCQRGTNEQVKRGRSYLQILEHYYPKAQVSQNEIRLTQILNSDFVSN
ncbi:MAG: SpoIID/LytB domain-containing protein [Bdellovibrio sp.]|nr:SpoIID/LytB domain-containing protein [Bdellovibrio sp.]